LVARLTTLTGPQCHLDTFTLLLLLKKLKKLRSLNLLLSAPQQGDVQATQPVWFDEDLTEIVETLQGDQGTNMRWLDHLTIYRLGPSSRLVVQHTASRIAWQNSASQPKLLGEWKLETERYGVSRI